LCARRAYGTVANIGSQEDPVVLHLIESGRHRMWFAAPTIWSAAAHASLVVSLVAATPAPDGSAADLGGKDVVFFLPLLPKSPPATGVSELQWLGDGEGPGPGVDVPETPEGFGEPVRDGGGRTTPVSVAEEGPPVDGSPVFLASELDIEVDRDPSSKGPVYPEPLRATNTQGSVVAEWIVDTAGTADTASFRIISSSHPLFTQAVRECLAGMRFRPAELSGQRVRQLVRQVFRYQLEQPSVAARDSTPPPG
jgi:TonB family protein